MPDKYAQNEKITVVLIDDNKGFQAALARFLSALLNISLLAVASSAQEALLLPEALHPDIVLLDLDLPDGFGFKLIKPLRAKWPHTKVIVLTFDDYPQQRAAALAAGATDFVSKITATAELVPAIMKAMPSSSNKGGAQ